MNDRRRMLGVLGAAGASALTSLAGCAQLPGGSENENEPDSGSEDGSGGEAGSGSGSGSARAGYAGWIGSETIEDDSLTAISVALATARQFTALANATTTTTAGSTTESSTDPLAGIAARYYVAGAFVLNFGVYGTWLGDLLEEGGGGERLHRTADGAQIIEGSIPADELAGDVENLGTTKVASHSEFDLYQDESGEVTFGISETAVIYSKENEAIPDSGARVRTLADLQTGDAERYSAANDDFDQLVTALPDRGVMGGTSRGTAASSRSASPRGSARRR